MKTRKILYIVFLALVICLLYVIRTYDTEPPQTRRAVPAYSDEITFQGYAWGESAAEVAEKLEDTYFESNMPAWSDADSVMLYGQYAVGYRIWSYGQQEIAGYDVENFNMFFMYGHNDGQISTAPENSELYLVSLNLSVVDIDGAYADLSAKLTDLYGEGTTASHTNRSYSVGDGLYKSAVTTTTWLGANNTGIILAKSKPEDDAPDSADAFNSYVVLSYGKTDSDSMLSSVYNEYRQMVAEEEQASRDTSNATGL